MKALITLILSLSFVSCSMLKPDHLAQAGRLFDRAPASENHRWEWAVDPKNKPEMEKFMSNYNDCKNFAYTSRVRGSQYSEADIHTSCLQRRGYKFHKVATK